MKPFSLSYLLPFIGFLFLTFLTGCEVVGGIFKAGFWSGIIVVALVVGVIVFLIAKMSGSKGNS